MANDSKKNKKVSVGVAHINAGFNNTIVSITDQDGNVLSFSSSGKMKFKGAQKSTPYAAQVVADNAAKIAIEKALLDIARYPDQFELKAALARDNNLDFNQIVLGNGSNNLLDVIARVFLSQGDESIYSQYAFSIYQLSILAVGATPIESAALNFGHDLNQMRNLITEKTKIIWIANPNNPTGTFLPHQEILNFLGQIPKNVIVVIEDRKSVV